MSGFGDDPVGAVTAFLQGLEAGISHPAEGEWGVVLEDVGGRPLEVGLRLAGGLLRVQAWACGSGVVDAGELLHRNRLGVLVRYAHSAAGEVHVHAELPVAAVSEAELDRLLGLLVEAAAAVRR